MLRKKCKACGESKLIKHFHRNKSYKDRRRPTCKACISAEYYKRTRRICKDCGRETYRKNADTPCSYCSKPKKICNRCGELKLLSKFYQNRGTKDGRQSNCIACRRKRTPKVKDPWCETDYCVFYATCRARIKDRTFDPYCFVEGKYHGLYAQEYGRGKQEYRDLCLKVVA